MSEVLEQPRMKVCRKCKEAKELNHFHVAKTKRDDGLRNDCKVCHNRHVKEYYLRNKEVVDKAIKVNRLKRVYGLSRADYYLLLAAQGYCCKICNLPQKDYWKNLCVDHDHATGRVRGLLCGDCNFGLGFFRDSPERLNSAKDYLISHKAS